MPRVERISFIPIYEKLFSFLGHSKWWPASSPFEVMVGAILTQNTSWKNVEKAIGELKKNGIMSPHSMNEVKEENLALMIKSSGYYNQKAKKLKSLLLWYSDCGLSISRVKTKYSSRWDDLRRDLLSIHGVGPETADSILCYAFELPYFVVDAYTFRLLERFTGRIYSSYADVQKMVMDEFASHYSKKKLVRHFNEFHALIVRLSYKICAKRNPSCPECPLKKTCREGRLKSGGAS